MTNSVDAEPRRPTLPVVIQGGMGVDVSGHPLAKAVSLAGESLGVPIMGTVSGTGIGHVVSRILQHGDQGGHYRPAFEAFPFQEMAKRVWDRYYIKGGKTEDKPYKLPAMVNLKPRQDVTELIICANFAEVWLARQGHNQLVAINYLEKIQTPRLPELFGAMLAGVDVVIMGAGIPDQVPGALDRLAACQQASYFIDVDDRRSTEFAMTFNPLDYIPGKYLQDLRRPDFYAIISSNLLAKVLTLERMVSGRVDGFIIENHTAGGHNASPRGKLELNSRGEPVYGIRDAVDLEAMKVIGRPFWLAGSKANPQEIANAIAAGATGIQAGSIFALCEEAGLLNSIQREIIERSLRGELEVLADPVCSPSGFPFNVVQLPGTVSEQDVYNERERICRIGYLRQAYKTEQGVGFRCSAEPVDTYVKRGGKLEDTKGKKCLCVNLLGAVGLDNEPPIVTLGRDTSFIPYLASLKKPSYSAEAALMYLLGR